MYVSVFVFVVGLGVPQAFREVSGFLFVVVYYWFGV